MRYTLKQLKYLEAAARLSSITAAANECNISPSSVAAAIDMIEAEIGEALFLRHPSKGITSTRFGRSFLENVRELLRSHIKFESSLPGIAEKIEGSIRLGCYTPIAPFILPLVLQLVSEVHPTLSVQIIEGDETKMAELMNTGKIDLALTIAVGMPQTLYFNSLFHAPPHVALSSKHPLAKRIHLSLEELVDEPLILLSLGKTGAYKLGMFEQLGLSPKILYSTGSSELVRSLVAAGFGYAIYNVKPSIKQTYTIGDIVRIPLSGDFLVPEYGLLHHEKSQLSRIASAVIYACEQLKAQGAFKAFVVEPVD